MNRSKHSLGLPFAEDIDRIGINEEEHNTGNVINRSMVPVYLEEILRWGPEKKAQSEQALCAHLQKWIASHSIRRFCGYIAQNDPETPDIEADLNELFRLQTGKGLVLPGFRDGKPVFYDIDRSLTDNDIRMNEVGASEPVPGKFSEVPAAEIELFLVPGVEGSRMVYSRNEGYDVWRETFSHAEFLPVCLLFRKEFIRTDLKKEYELIATPSGIIDPYSFIVCTPPKKKNG